MAVLASETDVKLKQNYIILAGMIWIVCATVTVFILSTHLKEKYESRARTNTAFLQVAHSYVEKFLDNIDTTSNLAGAAYLRHGVDLYRLQRVLKTMVGEGNDVSQLSLVSLDGKFIASNIAVNPGLDLSDRPHVSIHQSRPDYGQYISAPLIGRVSGEKQINISKLLRDHDGSPFAILVASVNLNRLATLVDGLGSSPDSVVSVFLPDGTLIARSRGTGTVGVKYPDLYPIQEGRKGVVLHGQYTKIGTIDLQERIFDFRWIADGNLLISHGTLMKPFQADRLLALALASIWLATLAVSLTAGWLFLTHFLRNRQEAALLEMREFESRRASELLEAAFNAAGVLIVIVNDSGAVINRNAAASDLLDSLDAANRGVLLEQLSRNCTTEAKCFSSRVRGRQAILTIDWVVTPSDWYGGGAFIAIAFDRSELDARERAVYQKERLLLLGEVSTGLAHEMAQPLTVLNVAATILKSDGASASDRQSAQRQLLLAADRVRRTVERMKVFARRDNSSEIRRVFSVNSAVESALSLTRNDLVMNGVELTSRIADDDMTAYGDGAMFEQVLLNLIFNARDALRGAPNAEHKTIAVTACIMPDNTVRIRVADTGPGIAMSIRDRIFEPFFTTKSDGTGLGLALSFGIIKEMGGTIQIVESDRGATFQVELPRVQEAGHEYNDVQSHEERLQEA